MKAYKCHCKDDDHGASIVFAETSKLARSEDLRDCDCEFIDKLVHRAKRFDKYAPGPVTIQQYLAEGWFWICSRCEGHIYEDDPYVLCGNDRAFCGVDCLVKELSHYNAEWSSDSCHQSIKTYVNEMRDTLKQIQHATLTP